MLYNPHTVAIQSSQPSHPSEPSMPSQPNTIADVGVAAKVWDCLGFREAWLARCAGWVGSGYFAAFYGVLASSFFEASGDWIFDFLKGV